MALTLRDSHSYETQIIDAVRGVNRALGGTYGTSSAIHKSEFNQYEVQLIDAIKGIGRTLSGNGLSLAGGGASSKELQDLAKRVTKLESESFFRLVSGNVTLKEQYQNLWVPGWLAAGGIGTGGGGGGVSYLRQLEDVFHNDSGILRGDGDPVDDGDIIVYDETSGMWVAAANSPAGAVTNYGDTTTGRIAKVGTVDIYNGVKWGSAGSEADTFTLTVNGVTKTVALQGYGGGGGGGAYALGTLTTAAATKGTMLGVNAISNDLASTGSESSLIEWEPNAGGTGIGAWHFHGNLYSDGWIAAGGTGTPGGGGGGVDLSEVWNSLTNTVADQWATTKINLAHIPAITASMVSDLATWTSNNLYTLRTHVSTTAANGTLLGVDALSNVATSAPGSDLSRMEWNSTLNAWHVYGNLYADGWVAAGGVGSGGGGSSTLGGLSDVTLTNPTDGQVLKYSNGVWVNGSGGGGDVYIGNESHSPTVTDVVESSYENRQVLCYIEAAEKWTNVRLSLNDIDLPSSIASASGYLYHDPVSGWAVMPGGGGGGSTVSWGTVYSDYTVDLTVNGVTKNICLDGYDSGGGGGSSTLAGLSDVTISSPTSGQILKYNGSTWVNGSAGGGSATALTDLSDVSLSGLTNGQALVWDASNAVWKNATVGGGGGGGYIGTTAVQSSSAAQDLTGILSIKATSSNTSKMVWDSSNSAWHFLGNVYADGWIAAGGIGSNYPGTVGFVQLTQYQYNNLGTYDPSTIYYVTSPGSATVYLGSIQLSN